MFKKKTIIFISTYSNQIKLYNRFKKILKNNTEYNCKLIDTQKIIQLPFNELLYSILPNKIYNKLKFIYCTKFKILNFIIFKNHYLKLLENTINLYNTKCIVFLDQYIRFILGIIYLISKKHKIPIIVIPYVSHYLKTIIQSRKKHPTVLKSSNSVIGKITKYYFPKWIIDKTENKLLWADPFDIIGLYLLKIKIINPIIGIQYIVDSFLAANNIQKKQLLDCGFDANKVFILGDLVYDIFCEEKKKDKEWKKKYNISLNKKIIVYSIVPELENNIYGTYEKYLQRYKIVFDGLKDNNWSVILNPHPCSKDSAINYFKNHGYFIFENDITELLPHADLYITSYSTTIMWAIALGIPVIDHDIYNRNYSNYANINTVKIISGIDKFESFINSKVLSNEYFNYWTTQAAKYKINITNNSCFVLNNIISHINYLNNYKNKK